MPSKKEENGTQRQRKMSLVTIVEEGPDGRLSRLGRVLMKQTSTMKLSTQSKGKQGSSTSPAAGNSKPVSL